ncbi:MAG: N-acetylmuramoyl-L-alanine amidase [Chloroflexi bacterium]|nr:N-acetylmuramoyl-L-alanine amidase [Chloroflexota bacterium]
MRGNGRRTSHRAPTRGCPYRLTAHSSRLILACALVAGVFAFGPARGVRAGPAEPPSLALQGMFARAAREFGVPLPVLLAVSYDETRWEDHGGAPSTSGGYGPMYLTHVDTVLNAGGKGATLVRQVRGDPTLHTLDAAARLLRLCPAVLERDPSQNIRGGAALLASYAPSTLGRRPADVAEWFGAVARYSGSRTAALALGFADQVYATIRQGAALTTPGEQRVRLAAEPVSPDRRTALSLHLQTSPPGKAECPRQLACQFVPAAYADNNPSDPTDFGNYDVANRTADGLDIRYIVIHDTESTYASTLQTFQNPTRYASANYVIRSADGQITQMVPTRDIAWHAGNYYVNMHAIGIEHEGMAIEGATWYGEQLYQASARLVSYLARRYHIPLDRAHILGHDEVPGLTPETQSAQHWDPGPYWDWGHYMDLLKAPLDQPTSIPDGNVITIDPTFATNQPAVTYCYSPGDCRDVAPQPANFVYLRAQPGPDAPLLSDPALHPPGEPGTTRANDWGDKAVAGQQFYRVDRQGSWDAIDYGGQEAWLYDPDDDPTTVPSAGAVLTPRAGLATIPVFGEAYPEPSAYPKKKWRQKIVPLQYTIPAGQMYVSIGLATSDYYWSPTRTRRALVRGKTTYYEIFFNHRHAFVRAGDVTVQAPASPSPSGGT